MLDIVSPVRLNAWPFAPHGNRHQDRMLRIQENILAVPERRILNWLCAGLPQALTPDMLTATGFFGAALVLAGGALSSLNPWFLWLAGLGLIVNWAGDSLDGSLARYRNITRPRYGYFLDHSVDALNNLFILMGLGMTGSIRLSFALLALCGYYMLCIYVFLRRQALDELQLSFAFLGPTELRLIMLAMVAGIFFYPRASFTGGAGALTIYETLLLFAALAFLAIFVWFVAKTARQLRNEGV